MKFITPTLIPLTIFCGVNLAAPAVSNDATSVSCTPAYTGKLYVANLSNLTDSTNEDQRGYNVEVESNPDGKYEYLGKQWSRGQSNFIFERCVVKGWSSSSKEFGIVKMEEYNKDSKQAITALAKVEQLSFNGEQPSGHILRMEEIGTPQNSRLDKQWFQAEYKSDSNGKGYVTLALKGNPNAKNHKFDLPNVAFGTSEKYTNYRVLATKSDTKYSLALFDLVESK